MRASTLFSRILLFCATVAATTSLSGQAGTFDESFGLHGKTLLGFEGFSSRSYDVAVQADSKILLGGAIYKDPTGQAALVRLLPDGTPDSTFGTHGKVVTFMGNGVYVFTAEVLVQPDGRIILVGVVSAAASNKLFMLRFNPDGTPDNTFGTNGKMVTTNADGSIANVAHAVLQPDGKIVVSGSIDNGASGQDVIVLRVLASGKLDNTFDLDGKAVTNLGSVNDVGRALALQPDGRIVVAGWKDVEQFSSKSDLVLLRYLPDGSLDESFGDLGIVIASFSEVQDHAHDVLVLPDGDILMTGFFQVPVGNYDFTLVKYHPDGTPDTNFGNGGLRQYDLGSQYDTSLRLGRQTDGKIVLVGSTDYDATLGYPPLAVLRLNPDFSPDSTFGVNGVLKNGAGSVIGDAGYASGLAFQPDGKILIVCDEASDSTGRFHFCALRISTRIDVGVLDFSDLKITARVYPNPVQAEATLQYTLERDEHLTVTLHDLNGRLLHTCLNNAPRKTGEHRETVAIPASLPAGAYVLSIGNGRQRFGVKMLKQ